MQESTCKSDVCQTRAVAMAMDTIRSTRDKREGGRAQPLKRWHSH